MIDWLFAPIDATRGHAIDMAAAWHGRMMVAAWGVLFPAGILAARFLKVRPGQDWPHKLDDRVWWNTHLITQYTGAGLTLAALILVWQSDDYGGGWHPWLGYATLFLCGSQVAAAWLRGTKGGPTECTPNGSLAGDHYDMTPRRRIFEYWHKSVGYIAIAISCCAILTGLWLANAYGWMFAGLTLWWLLLVLAFIVMQRKGMATDTYQAIWGPEPRHPGNRMKPIGWGVRRLGK